MSKINLAPIKKNIKFSVSFLTEKLFERFVCMNYYFKKNCNIVTWYIVTVAF